MTVTASRDESSDSPGYAGPSGLDGTITSQCFKSRPSIWTAPSNFTYSRSPWSQAPYTTDLRICSSAQTSATVSRRSSGIAAIEGGSERSERVSPASVNGLHSAASADTTASSEGQGGARDSAGLPRVATPCTSSSGPCQGEGRRFEPGVPLQSKAPVSETFSEPGLSCLWASASAWNKDGTSGPPEVSLAKTRSERRRR